MSAVSKSVIPRSSAFATTARAPARSTRLPKLLQPRPTAETWRPEWPRFRSSTPPSVPREAEAVTSHLVERGATTDPTRRTLVDRHLAIHLEAGRRPSVPRRRGTYGRRPASSGTGQARQHPRQAPEAAPAARRGGARRGDVRREPGACARGDLPGRDRLRPQVSEGGHDPGEGRRRTPHVL